MTEQDLIEEKEADPFVPFRLHLVSGKTVDVMRHSSAMPLHSRLLVFKNVSASGSSAEGYETVAYHNIERLPIGREQRPKRKRA